MRTILGAIILCGFMLSARAVTYGQNIVAAVLMAEAWSEGDKGMMAVAEVIRRRADLDGVSPLAIVMVPKHFSCLNRATPEQLYKKFQNEPDFQKALQIARILYNEPHLLPGYAKGADHFTRSDEKPFWAQGRPPVTVIGNHSFYRLRSDS